jgi:hypothetical protein
MILIWVQNRIKDYPVSEQKVPEQREFCPVHTKNTRNILRYCGTYIAFNVRTMIFNYYFFSVKHRCIAK